MNDVGFDMLPTRHETEEIQSGLPDQRAARRRQRCAGGDMAVRFAVWLLDVECPSLRQSAMAKWTDV